MSGDAKPSNSTENMKQETRTPQQIRDSGDNPIVLSKTKFKQILKYCGTTSQDVCSMMGYTAQCLWSRNKRQSLKEEHIYALCYVLSVLSDEFVRPEDLLK